MNLAPLYEKDETAWLEQTARLMRHEEYGGIDYRNLGEFLTDMAIREKREVLSRLQVMLTHLLKWKLQPERRSESWTNTIREQRRKLQVLLESRILRTYAGEILGKAYAGAVSWAAEETRLERRRFPERCPYTIDELLQSPPEGG